LAEEKDKFGLENNLIWEKNEPHRLCAPYTPQIFRQLMEYVHDSALGGHLGVDKTLDKFNREYLMWNASRLTRKYVRACNTCHKVKACNTKPYGLLQPLEVPEGRWTSVAMDFITGLPMTKNGFDAITVFTDRLTKRSHFAPCKKTDTAEDVAHSFLHGLPRSIVSDRDPKFTSTF
jgi:hypothetical protein